MQFGQGGLPRRSVTAFQLLEVLGKARVHVVRVNLASVDLGDVAVDIDVDVDVEGNALASTATACPKLLVALQQRQVLQLRDGNRNRLLGLGIEFVEGLVPGKALDLRGLQDGTEPVELLGKGRPCRQVIRQLGKVSDGRRAEDDRLSSRGSSGWRARMCSGTTKRMYQMPLAPLERWAAPRRGVQPE